MFVNLLRYMIRCLEGVKFMLIFNDKCYVWICNFYLKVGGRLIGENKIWCIIIKKVDKW